MDVALKVFGFLATIAIVVTWHELGHYWAAKWAKVKVLRFSVGFGNIIKSWRRGPDQEEWALSAIPLGGYVKMLDERETDVNSNEQHRAFNRASLTKRSIIVAAGPFANFVLAIALLAALNMSGVMETRALMEAPRVGSAAEKAGLKLGDEIESVNGEAVSTWNDARWRLLISAGDTALLTVRDGKGRSHELSVAVPVPSGDERVDPVAVAGFGLFNPMPAVIGATSPDGVAHKAGLREGDKIVAINGQAISRWAEMSERISASARKPLEIVYERAGARQNVSLVPTAQLREGKEVGVLGIRMRIDERAVAQSQREVRYGPIDAVVKATERTWDLSVFTVKILWKMVTGQASLKNISGPVAMADFAGQSIQTGLSGFLAFIALISISIGVLNLLPIPMLDGGHLLYHAFEAIRGQPPSMRMLEWGQRIGLSFVVGLMCLAFFNDISRYFIGK
jgi:regulator of sigma E protease